MVIGEGELTLKALIESGIEPGMPGTVCAAAGQIVAGPGQQLIRPLDRLPLPARDLMPDPRDGIHLMETSRGCPHSCAFCETTRFYGTIWRPFSLDRVAEEVARLVEVHNAWTIMFTDDNFAASSPRVLEICERLRRGPLPAVFLASVRADDLIRDPAVIPAMAKARILRVTIGVETLEPEAATAAGKAIPFSVYHEAFERLRAHGIFSVASFMTGLPGQRADASSVLDLAVEAGPDAAIFVPFIPIPGTPLAKDSTRFVAEAADQENALALTTAFYRHAKVRQRLNEAEAGGGIRGLMARATTARRHKEI